MSRTITVYPYGPDIQRHFEDLIAAGVSESEASSQSLSIEVEWPDDLRLPVVGDSLSVDWASGYVSSVSFDHEDAQWYIVVHLSDSR